jgi:exosortase/archaeosortase family protein
MLAIVGGYAETSPAFAALPQACARATAALLAIAGVDVRAAGDIVFQPSGFAIRVTAACTAALPSVLFLAGLLALRGPWRIRTAACAAGLLLIHLANLLRLVTVFIVGVYARDWFDFTHDVLGELLLIGATIAAWMAALHLTRSWSGNHRPDQSRQCAPEHQPYGVDPVGKEGH